jgi:hypothetical protein
MPVINWGSPWFLPVRDIFYIDYVIERNILLAMTIMYL